jgi:riboflavin biosynthesis pyrimidine reductase
LSSTLRRVPAPGGAERIEARLRALYGELPSEVEVLHVVSVWQGPGGELRVLRVGEATPRCDTDAFALSLARARADAIVTTGRILRLEPALTHELLGPRELQSDLREWRRLRLGRSEPARSALLTSGRELDLDHPLLRTAARPLILTGPGAAARLAAAGASRGIELLGLEPLNLRAGLAALRARGARCISIEAGPETALPLYDAPVAVDELLLSIYEAVELADDAVGPAFLGPARLAELLPHASRAQRIGAWRFERRTRAR